MWVPLWRVCLKQGQLFLSLGMGYIGKPYGLCPTLDYPVYYLVATSLCFGCKYMIFMGVEW